MAGWENEDGSIPEWQYNWDGGSIFCKWPKYTDANTKTKGYILTIYRVSESGSKSSVLEAEVTGTSKDVTRTILNKGAGTYSFSIRPYSGTYHEEDKSKKRLVLKYTYQAEALNSDVETFDSNEINKIKANRSNTVDVNTGTSDGWHSYPNNTWTYGKGNNTLAKNEWLQIDGKWYYFDGKGYMAKGWQQLNGNYYYFDTTNGYLWANCTTPDGYTVNAEGVRIDNKGTALTGGPVNASVGVILEETGDVGKIKNCTVKSVSNANLVSYTYSIPYEQWTIGNPVMIYVTVSSVNNFPFSSSTNVTCNLAKKNSITAGNPATIELKYYPKMKLTAPKNVTMNSSGVLSWVGTPDAKRYAVTIYNSDGTKPGGSEDENRFSNPFNVETTSVDISDKIEGNTDFYVGVVAKHDVGSNKSYYTSSDETKCYDLNTNYDNNRLTEGKFSGSGNKLTYTDASGNRVRGWQEIAGSWYFFDNSGYAKGPGWYQDSNGQWYYFNNEHKMQVGNITDNGQVYFMNDGSNPNFPYGAWVH